MALTARTRRFSFRSVHCLLTGLRKERRHGHQYCLEVTTSGDSWSVDGLVKEKIIKALDGRDLTGFIEPATGEVLVEWIHAQLDAVPLPEAEIVAVALQETRKNRFVSARSDERYV